MVCNDGQAVSGGHEAVGAIDHVPVAIAVTGGTEVDTILVNSVDKGFGVHQVGIWMMTAKVRLGNAVLCAIGNSKLLLEDVNTVNRGSFSLPSGYKTAENVFFLPESQPFPL